MEVKKIIAIGITTTVILVIMFNRFTRLLKGEQIIYFLARIGGLKDVSLMSLLNIAFVALFSFFRRPRFQTHAGAASNSDVHIRNRPIFLHPSHATTTGPNQKNQKQAA